MAWDEDRRRAPSSSKANDKANTQRAPNISGTGNAATARIARGFGSGDTRAARARLRLADWRPDERLEHLEQLIADGDYKPTPGERTELGLYQSARSQAEDDADRFGGPDAA